MRAPSGAAIGRGRGERSTAPRSAFVYHAGSKRSNSVGFAGNIHIFLDIMLIMIGGCQVGLIERIEQKVVVIHKCLLRTRYHQVFIATLHLSRGVTVPCLFGKPTSAALWSSIPRPPR